MDEGTGDGIPSVTINAHLKKELRDPWRLALIIKLLGKIVSFNVLMSRVTLMWKLTGDFELIDLGHGYYVVKFANLEDRSKVMIEGPWKIMDHYLTVQRWRPNFHPSSATIGSTAVWIQLPELPLEYFNGDVLMEIGRLVGIPLKLDSNTTLVTRGKFARICVEVDLRKPLVSRVKVGRHIQRIEYEGLHTVCFYCGVVGHRMEDCLSKPRSDDFVAPVNEEQTSSVMAEEGDKVVKETSRNITENPRVGGESDTFGPWMLVKRRNTRSSNLNRKGKQERKDMDRDNRFKILSDVDSRTKYVEDMDVRDLRNDDRVQSINLEMNSPNIGFLVGTAKREKIKKVSLPVVGQHGLNDKGQNKGAIYGTKSISVQERDMDLSMGSGLARSRIHHSNVAQLNPNFENYQVLNAMDVTPSHLQQKSGTFLAQDPANSNIPLLDRWNEDSGGDGQIMDGQMVTVSSPAQQEKTMEIID